MNYIIYIDSKLDKWFIVFSCTKNHFFVHLLEAYKNMKNIYLTILLSMSYLYTLGQENNLSIDQDSLITKLLSIKIKVNKDIYETQFYNIQLFNGDYKNSLEVKKKIISKYPNENVNLTFETPNYKVQIGPYRKHKQAIEILNSIKKIYPAAFLIEPKKIL